MSLRWPGRATETRGKQCRVARATVLATVLALGVPHGAAARQAHDRVPGAPSGEARTVRGRVVRGGAAAERPVANAWVVLHRVGTDRAAPLDSTRTDAGGRYAFAYGMFGDAKALYFASTTYSGIAYFSSPFKTRNASGGDAELMVHDTTSAPVPIRVRARHIVVSAPGADARRNILEVFELSNDSTVTRVAAGDTGLVWQSLLLDGARNAKVGQADFSDGAVRFDQGRVRLSAPFAPGLKQLSFTYTVPVGTSYALPLAASAELLEVLVEDALGRAEGGGIVSAGPTTVSGRTFARFLAKDVGAGAVVRMTAPGDGAVSGNNLRVLVIVTALGAVLLVGLARAMMRRQGAARATEPAADTAALRARLAALDETFAQLAAPTAEQRADHWQARARLTQHVADAVAREQGLT